MKIVGLFELVWIDLFEHIYLHEFCETVWENL